jgi:hypothetical protein
MGWVKLDDGFPHHPKVVGLSLDARWAYVESLCYAARYETDGVVPDAVAPNGTVRAELLASGLWENSGKSISIHDYLVYNPSREEARVLSRTRARAGAKGGAVAQAKREQELGQVSLGDGTGTGVLASEGEFEGEPFAAFWQRFPRKAGKRRAESAFTSALRRAPAEDIVAGAERYRDDPNREDEYTSHPTTWLNGDGWLDDPLPARTEQRGHESAGTRLFRKLSKEVRDGSDQGGAPGLPPGDGVPRPPD